MPQDLSTFLDDGAPLSPLARAFSSALLHGDRAMASKVVLDAVATGTSVQDVYLHVFQPSQYELGRLWETNRITVAQEHYCTAATQLVMSQLYGHVFATPKQGLALVATSVAGNLHELGVRMVADFFEMAGWDSYYLGADTPNDAVIAAVGERHARVLAVSATLDNHVDGVRGLINAVRREPECAGVQVIVGGRPFNRDTELWRAVGADGFAPSAEPAIALAHQLIAVKE
jgi:methanogenic corrinoid protein MtbC1